MLTWTLATITLNCQWMRSRSRDVHWQLMFFAVGDRSLNLAGTVSQQRDRQCHSTVKSSTPISPSCWAISPSSTPRMARLLQNTTIAKTCVALFHVIVSSDIAEFIHGSLHRCGVLRSLKSKSLKTLVAEFYGVSQFSKCKSLKMHVLRLRTSTICGLFKLQQFATCLELRPICVCESTVFLSFAENVHMSKVAEFCGNLHGQSAKVCNARHFSQSHVRSVVSLHI